MYITTPKQQQEQWLLPWNRNAREYYIGFVMRSRTHSAADILFSPLRDTNWGWMGIPMLCRGNLTAAQARWLDIYVFVPAQINPY